MLAELTTVQSLIYGKVKALLCEALNADPDDIKPDSRIIGDLGAESIDFLDITFRLERTFDISIPPAELFAEESPKDLFTVLSLVNYIQSKVKT